jgi:hypothetical protein
LGRGISLWLNTIEALLTIRPETNRPQLSASRQPEYKENHIDERVREAETGISIEEARAGQRGLFE